MASVNKVILLGRIGKDPATTTTPTGAIVTKFSLATSEKYKGSEQTEWHNVVVWNKLAEVVQKYSKKGDLIYIEGKITTRSWDAPDGTKKYMTEVIANQIQLLGSKNESKPQVSHYDDPMSDIPMDDDLPF